MKFKSKKVDKKFSEIKHGAAFIYNGGLYMKLLTEYPSGYNAVNLYSGGLISFDEVVTGVLPVNAEIVEV